MKRVFLGIALGMALTSPVSSNSFAAAGFSVSAASGASSANIGSARRVRVHRGLIGVPAGSDRDDHRRSRGGFGYGPDYYDASYDMNRSWDPDSFNDWWHDRPDRAYPRWVWHNRNCTEDRMWWSGSGWRCTP